MIKRKETVQIWTFWINLLFFTFTAIFHRTSFNSVYASATAPYNDIIIHRKILRLFPLLCVCVWVAQRFPGIIPRQSNACEDIISDQTNDNKACGECVNHSPNTFFSSTAATQLYYAEKKPTKTVQNGKKIASPLSLWLLLLLAFFFRFSCVSLCLYLLTAANFLVVSEISVVSIPPICGIMHY